MPILLVWFKIKSLMKNLICTLVLLVSSVVSYAQKSYQQDAIKYFEINGTEQQYSIAIDQMFDLLKSQYSSQDIPESLWKELEDGKANSLTMIKSLLVSAYRSNFTHEDIKTLIKFYESDAGKQMVSDRTKLTDNQKIELDNFLKTEVGKKVQHQGKELTTMVSEVSEQWSRDMYMKIVKKLASKGYLSSM